MVQMIVQHDAAAATVEQLGEVSSIMFIDLNEGVSMLQRNFIAEVKQCNAAERHIHQIEEQLRRCGFEAERLEREMPSSTSITDLMRTLEENARDLKELASNKAQLVSNYNHLVELSHVLQKCDDIFSEAAQADPAMRPQADAAAAPFEGMDLEDGLVHHARSAHADAASGASSRLGYVTGVVDRARLQAFERVLFRATRGNVYLRAADITQQVRGPHSAGRTPRPVPSHPHATPPRPPAQPPHPAPPRPTPPPACARPARVVAPVRALVRGHFALV